MACSGIYELSEQTYSRGIWANATGANHIFLFFYVKCLLSKGFTFCLFCIRVHSVQSLMEEDLLSLAGEAGEEVERRFS